jgi:Protein of unknown function (DUF1585)
MRMPRLFSRFAFLAIVLPVAALAAITPADAAPTAPRPPPTLDDYRHFRAVAIDLLGRMPTRDEVAEFEKPGFALDAWIDGHLQGGTYADRLSRVYMDLLRLEPAPSTQFAPDATTLYRHQILGPDGKPVLVYFRARQRRAREETDGEFCLTKEETGLEIVARTQPKDPGTAKPVSKAVLEAHTVLVKPWWLYRDYLNVSPTKRYKMGWDDPDPSYQPVEGLLNDPDGKPTLEIRVCREEAQTMPSGHVYVTGRVPPPRPVLMNKRTRQAPLDSAYAKQHKDEVISCQSKIAYDSSHECGCGVALEHCLPNDGDQAGSSAFYFPNHAPLGLGQPIDTARQQGQRWFPFWWSQEAEHLLSYVFTADRDFREVLTGRWTFVNGPLAQFYRAIQPGNCCGGEANFGMVQESEPLFLPQNVPTELFPHDVAAWKMVPDRGPHASGLLTTPMFLEKYASARARGATLYTAFLCKSFSSDTAELMPSTEPNLMIRPGCQTCHATLEPLAAYFSRIEPGNLVYLPQDLFPVKSDKCKKGPNGKLPGFCDAFYDVSFADAHGATLRSAYGSAAHADATPAGAGADITKMPEFAECAVQRVAGSFLGRALTSDDAPLVKELTSTFTKDGYRMRPLVRAILKSDAYRRSNNLDSSVWRGGAK